MADGQGDQDQEENGQRSSNNAMNANPPIGEASIDSVVNAYAQEYNNLDHMLDEIDSWMNKLEEQNDTLNTELDDLLESSRQARKEIKELDVSEELKELNILDKPSDEDHNKDSTDTSSDKKS